MSIMFITILAWVGLVGGTVVTSAGIWCAMNETELDRLVAAARGKRITYPIALSGSIMLVSGALLLAKALS